MSDVRTTKFTVKELQTIDTLDWHLVEGWVQPCMAGVEHAILQPQMHYWRKGEQLAAVDFAQVPHGKWNERYGQVRTDLLKFFSSVVQ